MDVDRRKILTTGWKVGTGLLVAATGWTVYNALRPLAGATAAGPVELGNPVDFPSGTATYFREGRLWLSSVDGNFFALSQKCPHLGCRVPFCESSGQFECACHGSAFDLAGEYVNGPSPRGMDRYELTLEKDTLVADTSMLITGPDRNVQDFLTPPKGPRCSEAFEDD